MLVILFCVNVCDLTVVCLIYEQILYALTQYTWHKRYRSPSSEACIMLMVRKSCHAIHNLIPQGTRWFLTCSYMGEVEIECCNFICWANDLGPIFAIDASRKMITLWWTDPRLGGSIHDAQ